jgi:hypothetical protein
VLGRRDPQAGLFDAGNILGAEQIREIPFYGAFAASWRQIFRDEDFAELYADKGRRSVPPSVLAAATLLQRFENLSDAQVVERTRYDLRWKAIFDMDPHSLRPLFAKSSLQLFRTRLVLSEKQGLIFETILTEARRRGLLPKQMQLALDSSPIRGRGAVKDAFNLLSDAIGRVLRTVAKQEEKAPLELARAQGLERHLQRGSVKGSQVVDWEDEASVRAFLAGLTADCEKAVEIAEEAKAATEAVELLTKVLTENVEQTPKGPRIPQKVPKGRTPSVHDEEMRHGHKSTGKLYTGHKVHVAVDTHSKFITAIEISEPSSPEGEHVGSLIEQSKAATESSVSEGLGDCAYGTRTAQAEAAEAKVPLVTKMPSPPKGRFGPRDFTVSEDGLKATCPAGHSSDKVGQHKTGILHRWSAKQCSSCPLKGRCLYGKTSKQRNLKVASDFHDRREREAYACSPEGREKLRERCLVEHSIGYLKNLGAGSARYVGRAKTLFQAFACGAVVNLRRLLRSPSTSATPLLFVALLPFLLLAGSAAPVLAEPATHEACLPADVQAETKRDPSAPRLALVTSEAGAPLAALPSPPRFWPMPPSAAQPARSRRRLLRRRSPIRGPPAPPRRRPQAKPTAEQRARQASPYSTPDPRPMRGGASARVRPASPLLATGSLRPIGYGVETAQALRSASFLREKGKKPGWIAKSRCVRRVERSGAHSPKSGTGSPRAPPVSSQERSQDH